MSSNNDYVNRIQVATSKTRTTNPAYNANIPPIFDFANSFSNDDIKKVEDAASFQFSPAQDEEYMSAVESGDMEKAERMVRDAVTYDESARRIAEYNVRVWLILSSSP